MTRTQPITKVETMKITIQDAAGILIDRGMTFEGMQPALIDGQFVAQYRVNGEVMTAAEVKAII